MASVVLVVAFVVGVQSLSSPDPRAADAPASVFSAGRAMQHVKVIARAPHPAGSAAMAEVADYLQRELERAGIAASQQKARSDLGVDLRNVVGRIAGRDSTGAVLFASHPDSVPFGPGAGDNATGAAVLLELARAVAAGSQPRNDVIVLFDDGEEAGGAGVGAIPYQGGYAFVREHPWMRDVRLVVGMDTAAWGVPHVVQFSDENGTLVRGYADGAAHPVAFGLSDATTRGLDFETAPFRENGLPALALEDNYANSVQHTAKDTVGRVRPRYVQHMGDQALGVARSYGDVDLAGASAPDRVFHTVPLLGVLDYPAAWSVPLALLAALGYVAVALTAVRRGRLRGRRLLAGWGLAFVVLIGAIMLAGAAAALYAALFPNPNPELIDQYLRDSSVPFALAAGAVVAALFALVYRAFARRIGHFELALGFLGLWLAFALLLVAVAPGASYAFTWPLLIACAAWLLALRPGSSGLVLLAPAAAAVFIAAPLLVLGFHAEGVANIPVDAISLSLLAGLIAPALVAAAGHRFAGNRSAGIVNSS